MLTALGLGGGASLAACSSSSGSSEDTSAAALSAIELSSGELEIQFDPDTTSYTSIVTNAVDTLTVTPVAAASGATIRVNDVDCTSGAPSQEIELTVGLNTIVIAVTAPSGTPTRTYTLVVARGGASCTLVPSETQGPYPLSSFLSDPTIRRADIRAGKTGVPLTVRLALVDVNRGCTPIANAAVYIWHCDLEGEYSGYSSPQNGSHLGETFLRGVQTTDAAGNVSFTSIYPGWYPGRITHIHVQIFLDDDLVSSSEITTQLAFPQAVTTAVYASSLYAANGQNSSVGSYAEDNVFSDGVDLQLATLTGDVASGYTAALTIAIAV